MKLESDKFYTGKREAGLPVACSLSPFLSMLPGLAQKISDLLAAGDEPSILEKHH